MLLLFRFYGNINLSFYMKDEFVAFLKSHKEYEIIVAEVNGIVVSAMFVYLISKLLMHDQHINCVLYIIWRQLKLRIIQIIEFYGYYFCINNRERRAFEGSPFCSS